MVERMRIATISSQRSGTKFLGTCMNLGVPVQSFGEVFDPRMKKDSLQSFLTEQGERYHLEQGDIVDMLDRFFRHLEASLRREKQFIHIDVMYNNLGAFSPVWSYPGSANNCPLLVKYFRSRSWKIIHLVRDSVLDCFLSDRIAQHRGVFHETSQESMDSPRATGRFTIPESEFFAYAMPILQTRKLVEHTFFKDFPHLRLDYATMTMSDSNTVSALATREVAHYLELEASDIFGESTIRQTQANKSDFVANIDQLRAAERVIASLI